ncbi:MAG: hypothetical protein Q8O88_03990 [bacterium]|nr:hypothetical protein [bacterium]
MNEIYSLMPKNPDETYIGGAGRRLYSHKEQRGMYCGEYQWTHLPTGRIGTTKVWCGRFEYMKELCEAWSSALPAIWKYVPIAKFNNTIVFKA